MKKWCCLLLAGILFLFALPLQTKADGVEGDVNGDGVVTAADAAALFRYASGLEDISGTSSAIADVTCNLSVTRADVRAVLLYAAGRLNSFADLQGEIEGTLLGEEYLDLFSYTGAIKTETGYRSGKVSVNISQMKFRDSVCYIADIYIRDISCLRTAFSNGKYEGKRQMVKRIAADNNAAVAITGDMYTMNADGAIVRNGVWYQDGRACKKKDLGVLYADGTFRCIDRNSMTLEELKEMGDIWQLWSFGPMLLDENGDTMTEFHCKSSILGKHPRTAFGYYGPGHYCFVLVDGRQRPYSVGLRMEELSELMYELGCAAAYNLDGGQSATMSDGQRIINSPSGGGRTTTDIVYVGEPLQ